MALFEIKKRRTGSVLFAAELSAEYDSESDGVKMGAALKLAISAEAYLAGADLAGADLAFAYLAGANLAGAYLAGAYLAGAYLAGADLAEANLAGADLAGAYLAGANLAGVRLGNGVTATKIPLHLSGLRWPVTIFDAHIRIGCQLHATSEWESFDDVEIARMERGALPLWRAYKEMIVGLARLHQAGIEPQKEAA